MASERRDCAGVSTRMLAPLSEALRVALNEIKDVLAARADADADLALDP